MRLETFTAPISKDNTMAKNKQARPALPIPPGTPRQRTNTIALLKDAYDGMRKFVTNETCDSDAFLVACEAFDAEFASAERFGYTPSDIFASLAYWERVS
jgi:hypothetical protein